MTTVPTAVAQAPSAVPLNAMSLIRLLLGIVSGYLVSKGHWQVADANSLAAAAVALITALWAIYKNTKFVEALSGWMTSPAVTLVANIFNRLAAPTAPKALPPTALTLLVALAFLPLMGGCSGVGTPIKPSLAVQTNIASVGYGFDVAFNQAQTYYVSHVPKDPAVKAQIKKAFAAMLTCPVPTDRSSCTGAVAAADNAVRATDQATLTQQVAIISKTIAEINAVLNNPATVPSRAVLAAPAH